MANLHGFDAHQVEPATAFEAIPSGKYLAAITESEFKPTKNGAGKYLQLTFQLLEGAHKGRILWSRLNLENANETAVKIARSELSAVCRAVGVMAPKDSLELHNIPLTVNVRVKKRPDTGELTNEIKGYEAKQVAPAQPAQVAASTPPWARS